MKKILSLLLACIMLSACTGAIVGDYSEITVEETKDTTHATMEKVEDATTSANVATKPKGKSVNHMTEREFSFDDRIDFKYTGSDKILEAITDHMVTEAKKFFGGQGALEIPTPYIVKIDDSNDDDVKVYGNFYIYGYELYGTIFHNKNGGSFPGCYHLKKESDGYSYIKHEIAEDGSKNYESLVKICGGDENLAKAIFNVANEEDASTRIKYVKMYRDANNLRISGIKDYGWPVILFDDTSNAVFIYNFYDSYFDEFKQEDTLNDFARRIDNLKEKYLTKECLDDIEQRSMDIGADMVIDAQDVTDQMEDSLEAVDNEDGTVTVSYETGEPEKRSMVVTVKTVNGKRMITSIK